MSITLIPPREVYKILFWVTSNNLYTSSAGTHDLTRFPAEKYTLYSREECEELKAAMIAGTLPVKPITVRVPRDPIAEKEGNNVRRVKTEPKEIITELI